MFKIPSEVHVCTLLTYLDIIVENIELLDRLSTSRMCEVTVGHRYKRLGYTQASRWVPIGCDFTSK